jgi:hypothetical protein
MKIQKKIGKWTGLFFSKWTGLRFVKIRRKKIIVWISEKSAKSKQSNDKLKYENSEKKISKWTGLFFSKWTGLKFVRFLKKKKISFGFRKNQQGKAVKRSEKIS